MKSFDTLDRLLGHIIEVETEMIALSGESHRRITQWIRENGLNVSDTALEALQYQDILSQQLGATIEAIEGIRIHLGEIACASASEGSDTAFESMDAKLAEVLGKAQEKREAFSGRSEHEEEIEFF